jgi:hypothetical protein
MSPVGRHSGDGTTRSSAGSAYVAHGFARRRVLVHALLVTATLVAWGILVFAAIDFGAEARSGSPTAWLFLVLATLGAAACLFVTLLLGARLTTLVKAQQASPRPPGRRRAVR